MTPGSAAAFVTVAAATVAAAAAAWAAVGAAVATIGVAVAEEATRPARAVVGLGAAVGPEGRDAMVAGDTTHTIGTARITSLIGTMPGAISCAFARSII